MKTTSSSIAARLLNQGFPSLNEKPCVICGQWKYKNETKRYSPCEMNCAKNFIKAYNFNKDEAYNKCILCKTPGDVFAAIYAHKNCRKMCRHLMMLKEKKQKDLKSREQLINYVEV